MVSTFTLTLPSDYPLHVQTGEIAAQQWEAIGIDVDIELVEWGTWLDRVYTQRDYDVSIVGFGWQAGSPCGIGAVYHR